MARTPDERHRDVSTLTDFLFPAPAPRRVGAIIGWWEKRRLAYNLWVGAAGSVSLVTFWVVNGLLGPGPLVVPSLLFSAAFGTLANICYWLGPSTEILIQKVWGRQVLPTGPTLYRMGLTFSVGLALLPTLILTMLFVIRVISAVL
jgi:hypothetical protein